ncbi:MAG: NrsF family protein [Bdellovibrionales bacterium]
MCIKRKKTEELISNLCEDHHKVKTMGCAYKRALYIMATIVIYNVLIIKFFDVVRHDISDVMHSATMLYELIIAFSIGASAVLAMSLLMIPDMKGHKWFLSVPTTISLTFLLWMSVNFFQQGYNMEHVHPGGPCFVDGILYAGLPTFIAVVIARRGATAHRIWLTVMAALSASSIGWISLRFVCALDSASHVFVDHVLPFALIGILLGVLSKRLFSW